jgi:hypothetical protein
MLRRTAAILNLKYEHNGLAISRLDYWEQFMGWKFVEMRPSDSERTDAHQKGN